MALQWDTYDVEIQVDDRLVGGIPIIPEGADRADAYEKWARGQGVEQDSSFDQPLHDKLAADPEMPVMVAEDEVAGLQTGFRKGEDGVYIEARQIKAMLKEAAQRLGIVKKVRGSRQVLQHDLLVRAADGSQRLYLGVEEPSGHDSRPISVVTPQGPRTAIRRFDYVNQPTVRFVLQVLAGRLDEHGTLNTGIGNGLVTEQDLSDMLELGQTLGIGADRSQGAGTYTLVSIEKRAS